MEKWKSAYTCCHCIQLPAEAKWCVQKRGSNQGGVQWLEREGDWGVKVVDGRAIHIFCRSFSISGCRGMHNCKTTTSLPQLYNHTTIMQERGSLSERIQGCPGA